MSRPNFRFPKKSAGGPFRPPLSPDSRPAAKAY